MNNLQVVNALIELVPGRGLRWKLE